VGVRSDGPGEMEQKNEAKSSLRQHIRRGYNDGAVSNDTDGMGMGSESLTRQL